MTIGNYAATPERDEVMAHSTYYTENVYVFAFLRDVVVSTPLWRLMAPFQLLVWISIAILLIVSIFIILALKKLSMNQRHFVVGGRLNRTPVLNLMNVIFGNVIPNLENRRYFGVFARTLTIFWIFFWLIVRNSYQGGLYGYLHTKRNHSPYETVENVQKSNVIVNLVGTSGNYIPENFVSSERYCIAKNIYIFFFFLE